MEKTRSTGQGKGKKMKTSRKPLEKLGTVSDYHGFRMHDFELDGCKCKIVEPKTPRPGKQWVWKAEFFEAFPKFELEMLARGFYLAFMSVGNTFGCPNAMKHFDVFYKELYENYGFAERVILLGLSRGGLYIYNWGSRNLDKVACVYGDNAVCDFRSWPAGRGTGIGSKDDWAKLIRDYEFKNEAEALAWTGNPVDNLRPFIKAGIPLVHTAGVDDTVVPSTENIDVLEKNYRGLGGGKLKVFRHPGGHHPHGLEDPAPLIEHILNVGIGLKP